MGPPDKFFYVIFAARCCAKAVMWSLAGRLSLTFVYCVETAKDTAMVATECDYETVPTFCEWYHFQ